MSAARKATSLVLLAGILSACLLDGDGPRSSAPGYLGLRVKLGRNVDALMKSAGADTLFHLDSIKIELSATGAATQVHAYPISGRPDTGSILVEPVIYGLDPLRVWKARIFTIDTTLNPARSDTVHLDSVAFSVHAAETTFVTKTVNPHYALLKVRLVSNAPDSLGSGLRFLRVRVNGVTRDSIALTSAGDFRGIFFPTVGTGWALGDGGSISKSTDSGATWWTQNSGTTKTLRSLWFVSNTTGWASGDSGTILRTTNGGTNWTTQFTGTKRVLRRVMFINANRGYAAGDSGTILRTDNGGVNWYSVSGAWYAQATPAASHLRSVFFKTNDSGWAVGDGGKILRTGNNGNAWVEQTSGTTQPLRGVHFLGAAGFAVGDSGKVLRTANLGGTWSTQTSNTPEDLQAVDMSDANTLWAVGDKETIVKTTNSGTNWTHQSPGWSARLSGTSANLKSIYMGVGQTGWSVGAGGAIRKTVDGGTTWSGQTSPNSQGLNTVFATDANRAYAVGDGGTLIKTNHNGTTWVLRTSNTTQNLRDVDFFNATAGWAVGDSETILRTTDSANWTEIPGGWVQEASGTSKTLRAISFGTGTTGWAVGDSGKIFRTTNTGDAWTSQNVAGVTDNLSGVSAFGATAAMAAGANGRVVFTTTGSSWSTGTSGAGSAALHGSHLLSATVGWVVGASGNIRRTTNTGSSFTVQTLSPANGSAVFRAVHSNGTYVWAVGDNGILYRKATTASGTFDSVSRGGSTTQLNGVYVQSNSNVFVVGNGGLIRKTTSGTGTASSVTWTTLTSGTTENLLHVHFKGTSDTGFAVGDNGTILETVDGGANWAKHLGVTGEDLDGVHVRPGTADSVFFVGTSGTIFRTLSGGMHWGGRPTRVDLRGVDFATAAVGYAVGEAGRILKTFNGGAKWRIADTSQGGTTFNGVYFKDANTGWVVGSGGVIRKTTTGGLGAGAWSPQTSGTVENLLRVHFKGTSDTGWAVGENGVILRTVNGGTNWTKQASPRAQDLAGVFAWHRDTAYIAGADGTILETNTSGLNASGKGAPVKLNATYCPSATLVLAVGDSGVILRSTNGGTNWILPTTGSGVVTPLYGVHFFNATTGWAVGAGGVIRKSADGGATWTAQGTGVTDQDLHKVRFASATHGFAAGANGTILRTVDGGTNWAPLKSGTPERLLGMHMINADTVYIAGENGTILKTRDSGVAVTPYNLNSTYFRGDTGYVVGQSGTTLRTGNGGGTWGRITGGVNTLNSTFISPSGNNVYAVGDGGEYMTTSNATFGAAWTVRSSGTTQNLYNVWVSGTSPGPATIYAAGQGVVRANYSGALGNLDSALDVGTSEPLYSLYCEGVTNNCWVAGGNQTVSRSTNVLDWSVKTSGQKLFDDVLTFKYFRPGVSNTVLVQAIDRTAPLRGYQYSGTVTVGASQDSTLTWSLTKCGYGGPACSP